MNEVLTRTLDALSIGEGRAHLNLTMIPLLGGRAGDPDYRTLDEALAAGTAKVTEVSDSGSVPSLRFKNSGDFAVLLVDGEELIGAKQNRVLNLTILAPAKQEILIPVSCVEAGRWSHVSAEFSAAPRTHYAAGRAKKAASVTDCMHSTGERHSDQGEVWADISAKSHRMASSSATAAMAAMFEGHARSVDDFVNALPAVEGQTGALFAIDGAPVGLDLFDHQATLRRLLPKLVRSYALDALDRTLVTESAPREPAELVRNVRAAQAQAFQAVGEGEDYRLSAEGLAGGALVARGRVIHLSAFRVHPSERAPREILRSRMTRPSARSAR